MWIDSKPSWLRTVLLGGFALPKIWLRTGTVTALATVITLLYETIPALHQSISPTPFTLIGLPLGIFLGFRNNAAYDRFWEGRKLWGSLVNTSRTLARQSLTLIEAPDADQGEIRAFVTDYVHYLIGYVHALRHHLRNEKPWDTLREHIPADQQAALEKYDNIPMAMIQGLGTKLLAARRKSWIHPFHVPTMEASLVSLTDVQGACERIKSTPIPYSYTVLLHRIVAVYCLLLPFGITDSAKWATPLVVLIVSYCFFGLDAVGDELEQPFGKDVNDLPLGAISRTIERSLRERLDEELPPAMVPKHGILD